MDNGRNTDGTFATGNAGGPGRPRRAVEREYLATLGDAVSLADWQAVVQRAVADAKAGDAKARDWLAKYLLGDKPASLLELAAGESSGQTVADDVARRVDQQERERQRSDRLDKLFGDLA